MNPKQHKYVIVSPVRDEEQYLAETINSIVQQTVRPAEWIIVDDGSRDSTGRIIDDAARLHPWIKAVHRSDRGKRVPGTGVIETFYDGFSQLQSKDWEFIVKLDGDLLLPEDYFQNCFNKFFQENRLGMASGELSHIVNGKEIIEACPRLHVRGPTKIYRRECWEAIGGLIKAPGWDTVDEIRANSLGWKTRSFPEIKGIHLRPTGQEQGTWRDGVKNGRADYVSGYHPIFMLAKCVRRLFQKPYLIHGIANGYGFITGYSKRIPRGGDRALIRYIRGQQMRRLLHMKSIWS